jgi:predicted dehydrogenase
MAHPVRIAVVGVGRIGRFHAQHVQELAQETATCQLVAVVDRHGDTAQRVATQLSVDQDTEVQAFDSPEALVGANIADAAVVASRTADHLRDTMALVEAGTRVLLEKPLGDTVKEAEDLSAWLDGISVAVER